MCGDAGTRVAAPALQAASAEAVNVEPVGLVTFAIGILALFKGADLAMLCFMPMALLGSAGAVLLGGAGTIQPAHLMLGFLVLAVFARPERLVLPLRSVTFPREGFWLALVVVYGVAGAFLLPRVFADATGVNAIGSTDYGPSLLLVPLGPTSGNITQSVYLVADALCFLTVLAFASTPRGSATVITAVMAYCVADITFAAIDIATSATDTGYLLGFIRNADYQLHLEEATGGMKRIVGSFTEASSFSYATVGALGFTSRLWLAGRWPRTMGLLSLVSLGLLAFSTSSTAYVATPGLLAVLYGGLILRIARRGAAAPASFAFLGFAPVVLLAVVAAIGLDPTASATMRDFLNVTLFDKSSSQSGLERAQWNWTALGNFRDTLGMGGGLGSIRASSFPLAVLSNLGVVGAAGFGGFFASILWSDRGDARDSLQADVRAAARTACAGLLIAATVSGALVDLGLPFYVFAALACAVPRPGLVAALARVSDSVPVPLQG
jgi:hypothetical protein